MKKLLAGILAGGMLFQTSAFADTLTEIVDIMSAEYTSATMNFDMNFELNKPMDWIGSIQDYSDSFGYYYDIGDDIADYQTIVESILESSSNMTLKANVSEDYKKTDIGIIGNLNLPLQINEYWKMNNDMSFGMWIKLDTSSIEDFKYEFTLKSPLSRKYIHFDLTDMITGNDISLLTQTLEKSAIDELQKQSKVLLTESLKDSAKIEKNGSKYILTFDNESLIDFLDKFLTGCIELSKESVVKSGQEIPEEIYNLPPEATLIIEQLKQIKVLGEKGLVIEVDTSLGAISDMNLLLDIDLNLYDILTLFGAEIPEFLTKDNSFISFTTTADYNYKDLNNTSVTFPEINEENCHFLPENNNIIETEEWTDEDYEEFYTEHYGDIECLYNNVNGYCLKGFDSTPYLYFRGIIREYTSYEYSPFGNYYWGYTAETDCEIAWDNSIITVTNKGKKASFDTLTLNTLTDEAFIDGVKVEIAPSPYKHIIVKYGNTYISPELAKAMFGIEIDDYTISFTSSGHAISANVNYSYPNPSYNPETIEF